MAGVASALKQAGYQVSGSDSNVYPPMSTFLEEQGILLKSGYSADNVTDRPDLVIVGNVVSRGNPELEAVLDARLRYVSLPEALKEFFLRGRRNLVVTGTHGKTTTTSLLTWLMQSGGLPPSFMIGGIPKNLGKGASFVDSPFVVIEGDEYDTAFFDKRSKFMHYLPEVLIINNVEFDHADIYENLEAIKLAFKRLVNIVPRNGLIFANGDEANVREVVKGAQARVVFVGCDPCNTTCITDVTFDADRSRFRLGDDSFELPMAGLFNVRNAAMAISVARHVGVELQAIQPALSSFSGVRRRQEVSAVIKGITVVDDFGHHPTAIKETLTAMRRKYEGARLWAFFEPRSNTTRRAVFQKELGEALALADGVYVSQVAKLEQLPPENRLNPEQVMADIRAQGREAYYLPSVDDIVYSASEKLRSGDVVIIFSNGAFDNIHKKLAAALNVGVSRIRSVSP